MANKLIIKQNQGQPEQQEQEVVDNTAAQPEVAEQVQTPEKPLQVSLKIRKGLDGRLLVSDHDHIDIAYLPDKKKIVSFAKLDYSDIVYETQNRLFNFLVKKGICSPETIRGGNVYGSLEATVLEAKEIDIPLEHILVLNLKKWLDKERPALDMDKQYEEEFNSMITDPDEQDSTELGEVPQEEDKGSIPRYASRRYIGGWW